MSFKKYYKLPLKRRGFIRVMTDDNHFAIDFLIDDENFKDAVVDAINDKSPLPDEYKAHYTYRFCEIYKDAVQVMRIRGWGYLTGLGACHLPVGKAVAIQDEFGEFIINRLNNEIR